MHIRTRTLLALIALLLLAGRAAHAQHADGPAPFAVQVTGNGRPVIFIPGLTSSGDVWRDAIAHLAGGAESHVLTLAGFAGQTPAGGPIIERVVPALAAYIHERRLARPIIVGHSFGGTIAMSLASSEPELVGGLLIVDSLPFLGAAGNPNATSESMKQMLGPVRDMLANQSRAQYEAYTRQMPTIAQQVTAPADVERVRAWAMASDPATTGQGLYEAMTTDLRGTVAKITAPTLVLGSWIAYKEFQSKDATTAIYTGQFSMLRDVTVAMSETGRHFIMLDDPRWFHHQLDEFLVRTAR